MADDEIFTTIVDLTPTQLWDECSDRKWNQIAEAARAKVLEKMETKRYEYSKKLPQEFKLPGNAAYENLNDLKHIIESKKKLVSVAEDPFSPYEYKKEGTSQGTIESAKDPRRKS